MKHILLFPSWIIASIFLTLFVLILSAIRREWDAEILPEIWSYKEFVRVSTNKAKAEL